MQKSRVANILGKAGLSDNFYRRGKWLCLSLNRLLLGVRL